MRACVRACVLNSCICLCPHMYSIVKSFSYHSTACTSRLNIHYSLLHTFVYIHVIHVLHTNKSHTYIDCWWTSTNFMHSTYIPNVV